MSSVASLAQSIFQRQRDRLRSERVVSHDDHDEEEGSFLNEVTENETTTVTNRPREAPDATGIAPNEQDEDDEASSEEDEETTDGVHNFVARPTMTLAELEEEREVARRRSSACFLFAVFILFRLWIEAMSSSDFTLLLVCLIGTSWTVRWIQYNRHQEAELDRRIAQYLEHHENDNEIARDDIRMLSFQAQLALAIMESQRQMMMGGYGHPDGTAPQEVGVSEQSKTAWHGFAYKELRDKQESQRSSSYGSLQQDSERSEEAPHCSICLGEYEEGESLFRLPCQHIYHVECINSWCSSHTRCPLCNYDLAEPNEEQAAEEQC